MLYHAKLFGISITHCIFRTFRLFNYIGLQKNKQHGLVKYYLDDVNNVCPSLFNDIRTVGDIWKDYGVQDPYKLNSGLPDNAQIPEEYVSQTLNEPEHLSTNQSHSLVKYYQPESVQTQF